LPDHYSYELRALVTKLMQQDPLRRPNINTILKEKILVPRIRNFLSNNDFKEEFAHTILHKHNVFDKNLV